MHISIPPHDGHPCLWLTLPATGRLRDFHPKERALTGRTAKGGDSSESPPGVFWLINQALKAHGVMHADIDYVVKDGEVIIVDEFTGRLMLGRRFNDGLHQACLLYTSRCV